MSFYSKNKEPLVSRLAESKFDSGISKEEGSSMFQTHEGWYKPERTTRNQASQQSKTTDPYINTERTAVLGTDDE